MDICGFASNSIYYSKVVMSKKSPNYIQNSSLEFFGEDGFVTAQKCMEEYLSRKSCNEEELILL